MNDGAFSFEDRTESSGSGDTRYGMGAYAIDIEGDGDLDLYVTNLGRNTLLVNDGTGVFTDGTETSGLGDPGYALCASFFDADADGDLDVYVSNYIEWSPGIDPECFSGRGIRDYCGPAMYDGAEDRFFRNRGDGTFDDATEAAGISGVARRGMGVITDDFDGDGDLDIYVANDGEPNLLWVNNGDGTFIDDAVVLGCAVNADGEPEASMGVACRDADDDGDPDLIVTHLATETHTFYRNDGGFFTDATSAAGIARWSGPDTGFGVLLEDFDRDGDDDLIAVNGGVMRPLSPDDEVRPYAEPDRLVLAGNGKWLSGGVADDDAVAQASEMGRAVIAGDLDGDSRVDLIIASNRGRVRVLKGFGGPDAETSDTNPRVLVLRLKQSGVNPDAIGALVQAEFNGGHIETRRHNPYRGYLSSHSFAIRIALPDGVFPERVTVTWPDGSKEIWSTFAEGGVDMTLVRGSGKAAP